MKLFENKFTVEKENGSKYEIAIGELYIILRDYNFIDMDDFENTDVLVAMPISISEFYITLYTICINCAQGVRVSGRDGNNLILSQKHEKHKEAHIVVDPLTLEQLLRQVPARDSYIAILGGYDVESWVVSIQCQRSNFASMNITPIGIKLTDLRHWPKKAISWWARDHLQLSEEQLQALDHFDQRWKMIAYAQEVFTYQCAEFNPDANEKMEKKRKLAKNAEVAKMIEQCDIDPVDNHRYREENYIIDKGNPEFLTKMANDDKMEHYFKDPESDHIYYIVLSKKIGRIAGQMEVTLSVDFKACEVSVDNDSSLRDEDFCVILIDGYVLHIRKDSIRDISEHELFDYLYKSNTNKQVITKRPYNMKPSPWHKPEDPVTSEDLCGRRPDYYVHGEANTPEVIPERLNEEYKSERKRAEKARERYVFGELILTRAEQIAVKEKQLEERSKEFAKMGTKVKKNKNVHEVIAELLHKKDAHEMNKGAEINAKACDFPQIEEDEGA